MKEIIFVWKGKISNKVAEALLKRGFRQVKKSYLVLRGNSSKKYKKRLNLHAIFIGERKVKIFRRKK